MLMLLKKASSTMASENINNNLVTSFENSKTSNLTNKDIDNDFIIEKVMENINKNKNK